MKGKLTQRTIDLARKQAGEVLTHSFVQYLKSNKIDNSNVLNWVAAALRSQQMINSREFDFIARSYEDMGTLMSTWFDNPEFLNQDGIPERLTIQTGRKSVKRLIQASRKKISLSTAVTLMKLSPSTKIKNNYVEAIRRVFVLPDFDFIRAAITTPRYFSTLSSNAMARASGTIRLLERQCSVTGINATQITPILRSIKEQGAAFVDSIDGQIESLRSSSKKRLANSEIGLLTFAWIKRPGSRENRAQRRKLT